MEHKFYSGACSSYKDGIWAGSIIALLFDKECLNKKLEDAFPSY